jgi:hypothetical protein
MIASMVLREQPTPCLFSAVEEPELSYKMGYF